MVNAACICRDQASETALTAERLARACLAGLNT